MKIWLKRLLFILLAILIIVLIAATWVEKVKGTAEAHNLFYGSSWFVALWALLAITSLLYVCQKQLFRRPSLFLLHCSFLVILAGAGITRLYGIQGEIHLRKGEPATHFTDSQQQKVDFPFQVLLEGFNVAYYPGTHSPSDFISTLRFTHNDQHQTANVSMNNIASYQSFRFYQSSYDSDEQGSTLAISYDPIGIAVSYTGYALLFISILFLLFHPKEGFRQVLQQLKSTPSRLSLLLLAGLFATSCSNHTKEEQAGTVPEEVAQELSNLYVLYNGRVCPLQTVAQEFTTKLYGSPTYQGYTPEQVLAGWMFYPIRWGKQPMIKIKSQQARTLLGIQGKYASWNDYIDPSDGYKLASALNGNVSAQGNDAKGVLEADEKYNLIGMLCSGQLLKLYPYRSDSTSTALQWLSQGDNLPMDMPNDKWFFIKKSMDYLGELIVMRHYDEALTTIQKIRKFQQQEAGTLLPDESVFQAEILYNHLRSTKPIAIGCVLAGIFLFAWYGRTLIKKQTFSPTLIYLLNGVLICLFLYLSFLLALRWYVSGHLPLANGFETMQFMAWCCLLLTFAMQRRFPSIFPFGFLLCGLTLLVAMMGEMNPQITPLMPVLASPLLSLHVVVIMTAYALLAFGMLNGITALLLCALKGKEEMKTEIERLALVSKALLYPAIGCLAIGIFLGAIWANVSWGRYWGWDPKEVWALITLLLYSLGVHTRSIPCLRPPLAFHLFMVVTFLSVLMTYFGVNFLLGGMHSYA